MPQDFTNSTGNVAASSTGAAAPASAIEVGGVDSGGILRAVTAAIFHNADQQSLGGSSYGLVSGAITQILNAGGTIDRQRETGADGISALGITTGAAQFAMAFLTTDSTDNFAAGTRTFTPAAMSGTLQGVAWSIQFGSVLVLDSGASQETVLVTAVTATTFTCVTTKAHNGTGTPFNIVGFVYNQEKDCAGELDGASGAGTAVAAEYEYNGGGGGSASASGNTNNYDRARNLQGKGLNSTTIASGGGIGSSSVVLNAAPTGLQPGQPLYFLTTGLGSVISEVQYVAKNYTVGSTTVPLQAALLINHATNTVAWDIYAPSGPGTSGFMPSGMGIEEEALWSPSANEFFIERSADADGMGGFNIVAENPALYNGGTVSQAGFTQPTFDRAKSASAANQTASVSGVGVELVAQVAGWTIQNTGGGGAQATASQAAGAAGVRHVMTAILVTVSATAAPAQTAMVLNIRDGASGAGTIKWSATLVLPATAGASQVIQLSGLTIVGSAATAMTIEFTAGLANVIQSVNAQGYDIQ